MKKYVLITLAILTLFSLFLLTGCDSSDYKEAISLYEQGEYEQAKEIFVSLGEYEDSINYSNECTMQIALSKIVDGEYETAVKLLESVYNLEGFASKVDEAITKYNNDNYSNIVTALEKTTWYGNSDEETKIICYTFSGNSITQKEFYIDGNGKQDFSISCYKYIVSKDAIVFVDSCNNITNVSYSYDNGELVLGNDSFYSTQSINNAIQGYWGNTEYDYIMGLGITSSKYSILFSGDGLTYEYASLNKNRNVNYKYWYYGPLEGQFVLDDGTISSDAIKNSDWFVNVYNSEVIVLHYTHKCSKTDSLPGKDGYSF